MKFTDLDNVYNIREMIGSKEYTKCFNLTKVVLLSNLVYDTVINLDNKLYKDLMEFGAQVDDNDVVFIPKGTVFTLSADNNSLFMHKNDIDIELIEKDTYGDEIALDIELTKVGEYVYKVLSNPEYDIQNDIDAAYNYVELAAKLFYVK